MSLPTIVTPPKQKQASDLLRLATNLPSMNTQRRIRVINMVFFIVDNYVEAVGLPHTECADVYLAFERLLHSARNAADYPNVHENICTKEDNDAVVAFILAHN